VGAYSAADGNYSAAIGHQAAARAERATAVGRLTVASGESALALGPGATASGSLAVAMGNSSAASGTLAVAIGDRAQARGANSMALGMASAADGENAIALGTGAQAEGNRTLALGFQARAYHDGSFVWADQTTAATAASTEANQFTARASGGVRFFSNASQTTGSRLAPGGNSWSSVSDRAVKENFRAVDPEAVLDKLASLSITEWNLVSQDPAIRHLGPMAQDFHAAFGLGEDDHYISSSDADGVALVAIQGLYRLLRERDARIAELEERLAALERAGREQQAPGDSL